MYKKGTVGDIPYNKYTSTSNLSGIPDCSGWSDSLINIFKNTRYVYQTRTVPDQSNYPQGWDEPRVRRVLAHYEEQTEDNAVAEDNAAFEKLTQTTMETPIELVPAIRGLIAKHRNRSKGPSSQ
jgi:hypothetical protein